MQDGKYYVVAVDVRQPEFMEPGEFCDEFLEADLREMENARRATRGCEQVYNLAADMGGMGFIDSNQYSLLLNNRRISENMVEASRENGVRRFFFASSACVYNMEKQTSANDCALREEDAYPAMPQDSYGREKLSAEEFALQCAKDFPSDMQVRIARYHNVYGPRGTWKGGREKAPAACCRKAVTSTEAFEMWGDGDQTRSFMYIDDCVEGTILIMMSDCDIPLNLGSEETISIKQLAELALSFEGKHIPWKFVDGPQGVRGRSSDNTKLEAQRDWKPRVPLNEGLRKTYEWIKQQVMTDKGGGADVSEFSSSVIVKQAMSTTMF
ncbi:unnamed protein product [Polarella glacialis]|uniref:NAD-dependent epimerase/dehydratase domain-containing protein n=1 Tax=Polarella glacialis TaxID=89957 RepID=A0A813JIW4_POLGL|nr:unnamed protein product [Polarella glacialis]